MVHLLLFSWIILVLQFSACAEAFMVPHPLRLRSRSAMVRYGNLCGDLWNELIEFSTLGPGERKMLQERRRSAVSGKQDEDFSVVSFQAVADRRRNVDDCAAFKTLHDNDDENITLKNFQAAVKALNQETASPWDDFDGYALRALLVSKWGAPLDVSFARGPSGGSVYCSVLPVALGSRKCRHETEMWGVEAGGLDSPQRAKPATEK